MQTTMIVLLLVGVAASFAMPTTNLPTTTAQSKPSLKDAVRMLLESSQLLQNWGNTVIDASATGLNAANVGQLMSSGSDIRDGFHQTVQQVSEMMKENGDEGAPKDFHQDIIEGAVEMLKEETKLEVFTEDDKLALIAGDKIDADTMRLRLNMHLFTRSMEVMESTVSELEGLLAEEVTETDIMQVLPELVAELGSEGTALSIVFKAIQETFDDASDLMEPLVEEEMKQMKEGEIKDKEEKEDAESRHRRSPRRSSSSFGRSSPRSFGSRRPSSSGFGGRSTGRSSGFSRDRRGWSLGKDGLSWSNRRGNVHFNVGRQPTFGRDRGGIGAQAGIRIEF